MEIKHDAKLNLKAFIRPQSSDEKVFREVFEKNSYQKREFQIEAQEKWLDLGANIGLFSVLAASKGAKVDCFEPDTGNISQIKKNLKLNGIQDVNIHQACVVHDNREETYFNLWPEGQSWRNSAVRIKKNCTTIKVPCRNFFDLLEENMCVKMDIEGSEIEILKGFDKNKKRLKKMVFEWSFDSEPRTQVLCQVVEKLRRQFKKVKYPIQIERIATWKFFPPAAMIWCSN